jgi:NAD(P)-dependent dehydrogenase (short-subunit alcohol dehydrogenase family)
MECNAILASRTFAGKSVFVTGGSSGINLAIAKAFAGQGASVAVCGRDEARLAGAVDELRALGGPSLGFSVDVRDAAAVDDALAATRRAHGPVDVLIAGAAGNFLAHAEQLSPNAFGAVVDIDLKGSFHAARAGFDQLRETRGTVIFVSAGQGLVPFSHQAHVGAAKAGVEMLMRNLAIEWGPHGIRSNSIVPGPITGTEGAHRMSEQIGADAWADMIPLGRFGSLDEIASMTLVLASPLAAYVTGATLVVDGGYALTGSGRFNQALAAIDVTAR